MTPTRLRTLLAMAALTGLFGWFIINLRTGDLLALPYLAPVTAGLIALFELVLAKVVRDKVRGRSTHRPMHPLQVARALVLAKASSATGALLVGLYGGLLVWFVQHDSLRVAASNASVAGASLAASLALVVAALLLERSCRTPGAPQNHDDLD
ncbi:MAG: hypothetical protein JWM02_2872 [Frankiales bacterium]|nr:hypothetical protein [Frankiales bacterium]